MKSYILCSPVCAKHETYIPTKQGQILKTAIFTLFVVRNEISRQRKFGFYKEKLKICLAEQLLASKGLHEDSY